MSWIERAKHAIPGGANCRSKSYTQFGENGPFPTHARYAEGYKIIDADTGREYIDWISGLGCNITGLHRTWANETDFPSTSLPSYREVELAEELSKRIPFASMWRFLNNGMDATMCAIKLARAKTERIPFISIGYHGHWEGFSCNMPMNGGTNPKLKEDILEFNGLEGSLRGLTLLEWLEMETDELPILPCAVIIEYPPITEKDWEHVKELSHRLQAACKKHGIILIIDEVLTFMRAENYCISNELGLTPDLICLGKALGNGYPLSAVGGQEDIMSQMGPHGNTFVSNTFNGFDISLASALHCLELYDKEKAYWHIDSFGSKMMYELDKMGKEYGYHTEGDPFRIKIKHSSNPLREKILAQQLVKLGHLTMPSGYIMPNLAHTKLNNTWIGDFREAMLLSVDAELEGVPAKPLLLQNR